ncbi:MAG: nucleotidyltransferase domain-containing protein [Proteobacteria bacterium]|nr:nucleotidyltransferase domain-containing protein [Pseudomonadota bacterium]
MQLANEATDRLVRRAEIEAACVLGSVARGEAHPGSDIDLMLVTREPTRPSTFRSVLTGLEAISLVIHTRESFRRLSDERTIFAMHIRDEGKVLFDRNDWLSQHLDSLAGQTADPSPTYRWASREVERYRDLARFNGIYHFAFARLYSVSRAVAIGITVEKGDPRYGKDEPFSWIATRYPALTDPAQRLSALRAFREIEGGYDQLSPPFDDRGADVEMRQAVADLEALLSSTDGFETDRAGGLQLRR